MATGKTIFCKKLIGGGVLLDLEDVEGVLPRRWFNMDERTPRIGVPMNYMLSLFTNSDINAMLKSNYFEIENMEELIAEAKIKGFIAPTEEEEVQLVEKKRPKEILLAIIKGGNTGKIKELFESADRQRALDLLLANVNDLSIDLVRKLEEIIGMALIEE